MKNINFRQPKYILPLIALPFLCLFFYVYHSSFAKKKIETKPIAGINGTVGEVSGDIKKKDLSNKLDAFRETYKEGDGNTAVTAIPGETSGNPSYNNAYSVKEQHMLDSINQAMKMKYAAKAAAPGISEKDRAMAAALNGLSQRHNDRQNLAPPPKEKDPMEMFKQQMAYVDSINKANDPVIKAEKQKKDALEKAAAKRSRETVLTVNKINDNRADFNTVMPEKKEAFIMAIIDESITGYAGSRIRLRLLEDIKAGDILVRKGTYLYALINGFDGQRVTLEIKSILYDNKLLPVKLNVYDLDGLPGLYVPESAFRDFTKDLGTNTIQGVNIDNGSSTGNQFVMSAVDKMFESTSTAIAGMIRKNKAKIKYNSYLYLIDNDALQNAQKTY